LAFGPRFFSFFVSLSASCETDLSATSDFPLNARNRRFRPDPVPGASIALLTGRKILLGAICGKETVRMVRRLFTPAIVLVLAVAISQLVTTPEPAALLLLGASLAAAAVGTRRMYDRVRQHPPAPVETPSRD
jgi:hypothetical protein